MFMIYIHIVILESSIFHAKIVEIGPQVPGIFLKGFYFGHVTLIIYTDIGSTDIN